MHEVKVICKTAVKGKLTGLKDYILCVIKLYHQCNRLSGSCGSDDNPIR